MIFTKNEEQILALERTTGSPRRTIQRSTGSLVLSFPPTPVSCFFLQLATWNFQLMLFLANGEPFNGQPVSLCSFLPLQPPTAVSQESLKGLTASVHRTAQTLYPIPAIAACEIVSASRSMFPEFIPQTRTNHLSHGLSNAGSLPGCAKASSTKSVASDCMTFICFLNDQVLALALASGQPPSSTPTPHQLTRTTFKSSFRHPRPHPLPSTGLASQRYSPMFLEHAQVFYVKNSLFCGNLCSLFARYTLLQPNSLCSQLYGLQGD